MLVKKPHSLKKIPLFLAASLVSLLLFINIAQALNFRSGRVIIPPGATLSSPDLHIEFRETHQDYRVYLKPQASFPITIHVKGPLGGHVMKVISKPEELKQLVFQNGIVQTKPANPEYIDTLPELCPRLQEHTYLEKKRITKKNIYRTELDKLNSQPTIQLLDPDASQGEQYKSYAEMDDRNYLKISHVKITNDYEDERIIDYDGPHPITGKPHRVNEGPGGFYANIHYAVVPYRKDVLSMDRQTLLHFAQGKLFEIDKDDLRPTLRTHSFIPGPFLSRSNFVYHLCEWGDTAYQAPIQELDYTSLKIWDWDYTVPHADHILIIVWEGDEEDWLYAAKLLHPFYLTDDLIGVFEVKRKDTMKPLKLVNKAKDFEMIIETVPAL